MLLIQSVILNYQLSGSRSDGVFSCDFMMPNWDIFIGSGVKVFNTTFCYDNYQYLFISTFYLEVD